MGSYDENEKSCGRVTFGAINNYSVVYLPEVFNINTVSFADLF